jgi:hypothetical protein
MKLDFTQLPKVVAVVGSRQYPVSRYVDNAISRMNKGTIIVSGGAIGVDDEAKRAAQKYGHLYKPFHIERWEWDHLTDVVPLPDIAYARNEALVRWTWRMKGHILIFALEFGKGEITGGSNNVRHWAKEIDVGHTIFNHKGEIIWTTLAAFADKI